MGKKIKKLINNKYFFVALVALLIVLVIGTGTYAWLTWSSPDTTKLTVKIGNIADVIFDNGKEINTTSLAPVFTYDQGKKTSFSIVKRSSASGTNINYTISLNVTSIANELRTSNFKYVLLKSNQVVKQDNFSDVSSGNTITLEASTLTGTRADFTFYIYIDGNVENSANMMNKEFKATINVSASEGSSESTMAQYITNLYMENKDGTMTNNGSNTEYNIASAVFLMNDRLGGTTTDLDGGNVRYYGENPDNYMYFNCSDYNNQSSNTCELWRIIGVFDGKLKIIRNEPVSIVEVPMHIGSATGINWKGSTMGNIFNTQEAGCAGYFNVNYDSSKTCDIDMSDYGMAFVKEFTSNMLKNSETINMIVPYPNYLFSFVNLVNSGEATIENFYNYTVANEDDTINPIYVGILDATDYGYASDFYNLCSVGISSADELGSCGSGTWLYNQGYQEYFINIEDGYALAIDSGGLMITGLLISEANSIYRPVVYLDSNVNFSSGNGSEENPYVISPQ